MNQIYDEYSDEHADSQIDSDTAENPKQNDYQTDINGTHYHVSVASSENAMRTYEELIKAHILNEIKDLQFCEE